MQPSSFYKASSRYRSTLLALGLLLPLVVLISAGIGAYYIPPQEIPRILWERSEQAYAVLVSVRFPGFCWLCWWGRC